MFRLRLLGPLDLRDADGREVRAVLAQPKRMALLAYLAAASPAGAQRRDVLLGLFWPELDQDHARSALSKAVHFLRRCLGEAALHSRTADELVLDASVVWVDVTAFTSALDEGRFAEAFELYRGDLLPSFFVAGAPGFEDWLERERARLRSRAATAARHLAEQYEAERYMTLAVTCARRAVELSDGDERALRRLIELLDRLGDRAGAIRVYEEFARKLTAELEVEPAPETVALIERLRASPRPGAASRRDPAFANGQGSPMTRLAAALADRYRIERELGAGAMAFVFLAQDLRHHRRVAIKLLRPELIPHMEAERFLREIDIVASLMHPHILPVHDSGEADGLLYYVMPYVQGASLRARLEREGRLPVNEALLIAREVADALAYAHHRGFVHRDIKPENILLAGGHALVADFGIAQAIGTDRSSPGFGTGTPAYMSPEQASGDGPADERTDIYALGCVLYEMLAGELPFAGVTLETAASQRNGPAPRVSVLREEVGLELEDTVARALARAPEDRPANAAEFAAALGQVSAGAEGSAADLAGAPEPERATEPRQRLALRRWAPLGLALLGVALVIALASLLPFLARSRTTMALGSTVQLTFEPGLEIEPALSPDGRYLAYTAPTAQGTRLFVRQPGGRPVPVGADSGRSQRRPLWSPDGLQLLFLQNQDLAVAPALGGTPRVLVRGGRSRGPLGAQPFTWRDGIVAAAWAPEGQRIAYVRGDSLYLKSLESGQVHALAGIPEVHSLAWAPDGRRIAVAAGNSLFDAGGLGDLGNAGASQILLISVEGGRTVAVTDRATLNSSPAWTQGGRWLLFVSNRHGPRDVYAVRIDASGRPGGEPVRVTTGLDPHTISLSFDGTRLAYSVFTVGSNVWSVPISSASPVTSAAVPVTAGTHYIEGVVLSPDFKRAYFAANRRGNFDIYRVELPQGEPVQVTNDPADEWEADESPDGRWLVFYSLRHGTRDIFVMPADGGTPERVTSDPGEERYPLWSPDGMKIRYIIDDSPVAHGTFVIDRDANGRWGQPVRVFDHGGASLWSPDGRSLLKVAGDRIIAAPLDGTAPRELYRPRSGSTDPVPDFLFGRVPNRGRLVAFVSAGDGTFWSVPEAGGRPRLLARTSDLAGRGSGTDGSGLRGYQTDGERFYYTKDERQSDIFVADVSGMR
jgi:Tol biopolymer transport system component/DNA-binding SARP family transcriptional activator/tRNA A-37 threonylcarbamoyl transferase component Bud32